jgi:hypothetical protein
MYRTLPPIDLDGAARRLRPEEDVALPAQEADHRVRRLVIDELGLRGPVKAPLIAELGGGDGVGGVTEGDEDRSPGGASGFEGGDDRLHGLWTLTTFGSGTGRGDGARKC